MCASLSLLAWKCYLPFPYHFLVAAEFDSGVAVSMTLVRCTGSQVEIFQQNKYPILLTCGAHAVLHLGVLMLCPITRMNREAHIRTLGQGAQGDPQASGS